MRWRWLRGSRPSDGAGGSGWAPGKGERLLRPGVSPGRIVHEATATPDPACPADPKPSIPRPPTRARRALLATIGIAGIGAAAGLAAPGALLRFTTRMHDEWLALRTIAVSGASSRVPSDEIASATGVAHGTSLLDIDASAAEERLLAHPWVAHARVVRVPPGTLVVSVRLREPVATVSDREPGVRWLVDAGGRSFAPASEQESARLPALSPTVVDPPEAGAAALAQGASVAQALARALPLLPAEIVIGAPGDPDGVRLRLDGLPGEVVLGSRDFDARLASLARLLSAKIPGLAAASAIDLRFADRAVLRGLPAPEAPAQRAIPPGGAGPPPDRRG